MTENETADCPVCVTFWLSVFLVSAMGLGLALNKKKVVASFRKFMDSIGGSSLECSQQSSLR